MNKFEKYIDKNNINYFYFLENISRFLYKIYFLMAINCILIILFFILSYVINTLYILIMITLTSKDFQTI